MLLPRKHLPRRTVLKGLGATVALPLLEAMMPAGRAAAAAGGQKLRLVAMEMVHGCAGSTAFGLKKNLWSPADVGRSFDLAPTSLAAADGYRYGRWSSRTQAFSICWSLGSGSPPTSPSSGGIPGGGPGG